MPHARFHPSIVVRAVFTLRLLRDEIVARVLIPKLIKETGRETALDIVLNHLTCGRVVPEERGRWIDPSGRSAPRLELFSGIAGDASNGAESGRRRIRSA